MKNSLIVFALILGFACTSNAIAQMPAASKEHQVLKKEEGKWDADSTLYYGPAGALNPPEKAKGMEVNKMIGPYWIVSDFTGKFGGAPFVGRGQFGYDAKKKKYFGTWIDAYSPNVSNMIGSYNAETKTMTYDTKGVGMDGSPTIGKNVVVYNSKDKRTMTMYTKDPDSDEMIKVMEMVYTRAKSEK